MRKLSGVGLGLRDAIAGDILREPRSVDLLEVVAEACLSSPSARREALAFAEMYPVVPHGVKLSLGSVEGIEPDRARALGKLAKELRAPVISEHVAFVRSGEREIGHLTALPLTRAALAVVERNVSRARRQLPDVPLLLENVVWSFRWPDAEMSEGDFYSEVQRRTGCQLLLDVGNLYANALNSGADPLAVAGTFPLESVGMIHIAGGMLENGFYLDDHAHPIADDVFAVLERVLERSGPVPIVLERDARFPPFSELSAELARARAHARGHAPAGQRVLVSPRRAPPVVALEELRAQQREIARLLTDAGPLPADAIQRFGEAALLRSREILFRKHRIIGRTSA